MKTTTDYIIAIPSYKRPNIIQTKTLATLKRHHIPRTKIAIFVADATEYDIYKKTIPRTLYGKLIIGEPTLKNQRNFISNYYPEGTQIVQLDDDLDEIVQLHRRPSTQINTQRYTTPAAQRKAANYLKPITNLDKFIKTAFTLCREKGAYIWGIYPIANAYFMTDTVTSDLRFIVGPMWGIINRHSPDLYLTIDEKENTQRTLQYWVKDGAVIRFNNISIITNYYRNLGGMQATNTNRAKSAMKSAQFLKAMYPHLTRISLRPKTGFPEVRLLRGVGKLGKKVEKVVTIKRKSV